MLHLLFCLSQPNCICRVTLSASVRVVIPSYLASIYRYHICHWFVCVCAHIVRYMDSLHVFNSLFIFFDCHWSYFSSVLCNCYLRHKKVAPDVGILIVSDVCDMWCINGFCFCIFFLWMFWNCSEARPPGWSPNSTFQPVPLWTWSWGWLSGYNLAICFVLD